MSIRGENGVDDRLELHSETQMVSAIAAVLGIRDEDQAININDI